MSSINAEIYYAMQNAFSPGQDKRSYRVQTDSRKTDKIFSYSSYGSIKNTSIDFCKYLKTQNIRHVCDVTPELVTGYLKQKSETCNNNTLEKFRQHIASIGKFCAEVYKTVSEANFKPSEDVFSKRRDNVKVSRQMALKELTGLLDAISGSKAGERTARALKMAFYTGLRVEEIAKQKVKDCHLAEKGVFGFGYIDVTDPKHGRSRTVQLTSMDAKQAVQDAINHNKGDRLFGCAAVTLQNSLSTAKNLLPAGKDGMQLKGFHSVRKLYAQETYNFYRQKHTKRETIAFVNTQLGHGAARSITVLRTYVGDIW